jgi:hypothetical protein
MDHPMKVCLPISKRILPEDTVVWRSPSGQDESTDGVPGDGIATLVGVPDFPCYLHEIRVADEVALDFEVTSVTVGGESLLAGKGRMSCMHLRGRSWTEPVPFLRRQIRAGDEIMVGIHNLNACSRNVLPYFLLIVEGDE